MSEHHLDARGLICPLPVLRARKLLMSLPAGSRLIVTVTDAHAPKDFALFCAESGLLLEGVDAADGGCAIRILKPAAAA